MRVAGLAGMGVLVLAAGGCSVATSTYNSATSTAGAVVGTIGLPAPDLATAPPVVAAPSMGAFLEGPVGGRLGEADTARAFQAEEDALASGERKTWRGVKGNYGFVALGGAATPEGCRDFTHTIYIAGRPVTGRGTGCKAPDGTWHVTG